MPTEITMPQLSDTMTEGTLVRWMKNEGDAVKAGERIGRDADAGDDAAEIDRDRFVAEQPGGPLQIADVPAVAGGKDGHPVMKVDGGPHPGGH